MCKSQDKVVTTCRKKEQIGGPCSQIARLTWLSQSAVSAYVLTLKRRMNVIIIIIRPTSAPTPFHGATSSPASCHQCLHFFCQLFLARVPLHILQRALPCPPSQTQTMNLGYNSCVKSMPLPKPTLVFRLLSTCKQEGRASSESPPLSLYQRHKHGYSSQIVGNTKPGPPQCLSRKQHKPSI